MKKQSPIFIKHYDLMMWLIPRTLNFPKSQRGVLARQIQQELFNIQKSLVVAAGETMPLASLSQADQSLTCLRTYVRLSRDLTLLSPSQFAHAGKLMGEVGRLLGGWQRKALQ